MFCPARVSAVLLRQLKAARVDRFKALTSTINKNDKDA
jgi:hypothetical protein